jgi:hypothetical protein
MHYTLPNMSDFLTQQGPHELQQPGNSSAYHEVAVVKHGLSFEMGVQKFDQTPSERSKKGTPSSWCPIKGLS